MLQHTLPQLAFCLHPTWNPPVCLSLPGRRTGRGLGLQEVCSIFPALAMAAFCSQSSLGFLSLQKWSECHVHNTPLPQKNPTRSDWIAGSLKTSRSDCSARPSLLSYYCRSSSNNPAGAFFLECGAGLLSDRIPLLPLSARLLSQPHAAAVPTHAVRVLLPRKLILRLRPGQAMESERTRGG